MRFSINAGKFPLGRIVMTTGAYDALTPLDMKRALFRHSQGDWGDLSDADKAMNDWALDRAAARLLSSYVTESGTRFYVLTESDGSATTVLLPDEY